MHVQNPQRRPGDLPYREIGSGPVLVFVHGLGVSSRYFVPLMDELADGFRCVAPDLPGHGRGGGAPAGLDVPGEADALGVFLDTLGLVDVTLVGHSLGCQVVAALAERGPARTAPLVLISPTLDPTTRNHFWFTFFRASVREPLSLLPILVADYLRFGLRRFLATFRYALADDITARLPHLGVPVLVIQGGRDHIVTVPWAAEVARRLPRGELCVVAGGAHAVHYSCPMAVGGLIRAFLNSHS